MKFDRVPSEVPPVISGSHTPEDPTAESEPVPPHKRRKVLEYTSSEEDEDPEMELAKLSSQADRVAPQSGSAAGPSSRTPLEETDIFAPVRVLHQTQDSSARGSRRRKKALEVQNSNLRDSDMSERYCILVYQTLKLDGELIEVI